MTKENRILVNFALTDILPAPRDLPHVEVTFEIDDNGLLQVSAENKGTGNKENISIYITPNGAAYTSWERHPEMVANRTETLCPSRKRKALGSPIFRGTWRCCPIRRHLESLIT